jgi:hypothetical protein
MKAGIYAIEGLFDSSRIGDISVFELDSAREILVLSAREVIKYSYRVPLEQQRIYQVRAHEPGAAGHEYASHPKSSKQFAKKRGLVFLCPAS